jgi:hypothetical protein
VRKIIALPGYIKAVVKLSTPDERSAMETAIAADPASCPIIPGTSGFRKHAGLEAIGERAAVFA